MTIANSKVVPPAAATPPHNGFSLISNDKLLQIYSTMLKCRMIQARIRILAQQNGDLASGAAGQEAAIAGVVLDLLPGDTLAPSPGGFIPCFVKGLSLNRIFSALSPRSGSARPRYAPLNLIPPSLSLAAQLDRAIAAAAENKKSRDKKIAVAFCGNSSASPDVLHEAKPAHTPDLSKWLAGRRS
jgi:TPP-dependent pyruvate/acetoin dehydrogenase alpha subunit